MARSSKHEKNLAKVQSMIDGTYGGKIQVGAIPENIHANRKVGDRWVDSDGKEWEQKDGYRVSVRKTPSVGIFPHTCKDCGENCDVDKRNKATFLRMERCYYCQLNFEVDLKAKGKWEEWVMEQEEKRWEGFLKERGIELEEIQAKNPYDETVANALANGNVDTTMKINKSKLK
tara:strand:+ start:315 stop:836 length:522 start_codon:yes stop_codon:yes gene_type:complete